MNHQGYMYVLGTKPKSGIKYYKCKYHKVQFCKGSIKVRANGEIVIIKEHNHTPLKCPKDLFRKVLVLRASKEFTPLHQIYEEEKLRHEEGAELYSFAMAESAMRSARKRAQPTIPETIQELGYALAEGPLERQNNTVPRLKCHEQNICLGMVTSANGYSAILFMCQSLTDKIAGNLKEVHIDATFKGVPRMPNNMKQLLTLHGITQDVSIPLVYVLMETKRKELYDAVFNKLKEQIPTLRPTVILTDFETALQSSCKEAWVSADVKGSFFHFAQGVWKTHVKKGYWQLVRGNSNAAKVLKMMMAIPLLPANRCREGFEAIKLFSLQNHLNMQNMFAYIERYWLNFVGPETLSVWGSSRRTNNNVESFHNYLREYFKEPHPNIWTFLIKLNMQIKRDHDKLGQALNGIRVTRPRNHFRDTNIKQASRLLERSKISVLDFMKSVSHSVDHLEGRLSTWRMNVETEGQSVLEHDSSDDEDSPTTSSPQHRTNSPPLPRVVHDNGRLVSPVAHRVSIPNTFCENDSEILSEVLGRPDVELHLDEESQIELYRKEFRETRCPVCLLRRKEFMLSCHHLLCGVCAPNFKSLADCDESIEEQNYKCPVCRALIKGAPIKVY